MRLNLKSIRIVSTVVLAFFLWTFGGVFEVAYAVKNSDELRATSNESKAQARQKTERPEEKFQKTLQEIEQTVEGMKDRVEVKAEKEKLKTRKAEIEALDAEIKKQLQDTGKTLKDKGLPSEILDRHDKFVRHYEDNLKELKSNLDAIDKAKTEAEVKAEVEKTIKFLEKVKPPKKHVPLDPNKLPHRTAEPVWIEPRTSPEQFWQEQVQGRQILIASNGPLRGLISSEHQKRQNILLAQTTSPPTPADLSETIEVQFTPEIKAKAEELNYNPVKIYNWVRNNIEFVPTYGSIQGANMCLQTKQCNAFDTASLLIALLRASNIPARYVYGTIELPIEKVMNWVGGFTDPNSALTLIASGGIPVKGITSGGKLSAAQMEHVWVEAYVPYGNYRGTMVDQSIKTWIPMDGSYKQYEYTAGLDIAKTITFDKSSYLSKFNEITPVDFYFQQLQTYLDANFPGKTLEDVKRTKTIKVENLELLSPTLPYKTIAKLSTFSSLTDTYRFRAGIVIPDLFGFGLSYQISIPEILGKRVTISYIPSTPEDEQLIMQYGGFYNVPAYLLMVKPAVKVEGAIVALGDEISVGIGQELNVSIIYPSGVKTDRVVHEIKAGGYYAIGLAPRGIKEDLIKQRFEKYKDAPYADYQDPYNDPLLGEVLNMTIMRYFCNLDGAKSQFAEVVHYAYSKDISEGLTAANIDVSYIYGIPYTINLSTFWIDMRREVSILLPIDGDKSKKIEMNPPGFTGDSTI